MILPKLAAKHTHTHAVVGEEEEESVIEIEIHCQIIPRMKIVSGGLFFVVNVAFMLLIMNERELNG
jgi:hypothetical protein